MNIQQPGFSQFMGSQLSKWFVNIGVDMFWGPLNNKFGNKVLFVTLRFSLLLLKKSGRKLGF